MLLVMGCGATTRCLLQRGVDSTEFSGSVLAKFPELAGFSA